jgi:hypothetical protein
MSDETKPQDGKAMSPASAGSQPVAWRVYSDDGSEAVYSLYEQARAAADEWNWSVEPLYRHPRPMLTDREIEALEWAAITASESLGHAEAIRGLLERLDD